MLGTADDFRRLLLRWYTRFRRDLPWRVPPGSPRQTRPDPYHVLLSETMLQQTQVATVITFFNRFLARFPTIRELAGADVQEVLRFWQGLGYYSRARNLHACAKALVERHGGTVPADLTTLMGLPGIGRYTAGAIASIAFDRPAPIVDGNVMRVLCRLDCIRTDPRQRAIQQHLWKRAEELVPPRRAGDFNSAMMELGATICTPRNPQCLACPVRPHCQAAEAKLADEIPMARKSRPTPLHLRWILGIRSGKRFLVEQRPPTGRWAGMWQFKTIDPGGRHGDGIWETLGLRISPPRKVGTIEHALTHRRYRFVVFRCELIGPKPGGQIWTTLDELDSLPMSRPQIRARELLAAARLGDSDLCPSARLH